MKLYDINQEIMQVICEAVDVETGEVIAELDTEKLTNLKIAREEKVLNLGKYIKNLDAELTAVSNEKAKFVKWEQSLKKRIESIKTYLAKNMAEGEKFKDAQIMVSWRMPGEQVHVSNVNMIPEKYKRITVEPDKVELKKAIKNGEAITGAYLQYGEPGVLIR
ncbi:siphovirus Gp157 family protein [Fastidiosibacter lacustris]|uniref:siphovirus Gp157 family protein n=1 Tax=Fastidiosibacter lacustris TaxID=2056695 RepID=UPI000E342CB6|nr:siphovirus Gp157 family protein [Fastidiosibacter lacustris]